MRTFFDSDEGKVNPRKYCRSAQDTYVTVLGLLPGSYSVKVRAQSPAGNGSWSDEEMFTIDQSYMESSLILPVGISVGVLLIVLIVVFLYYVCFRR